MRADLLKRMMEAEDAARKIRNCSGEGSDSAILANAVTQGLQAVREFLQELPNAK